MARYRFQVEKRYPARLLAVLERPIENQDSHIRLFRLEFEIFQTIEESLRSTGKIACRDLVLAPGYARDLGVVDYANALGIRPDDMGRTNAWLKAAERAHPPWVWITFEEADPEDLRNPFADIQPLNPVAEGFQVHNYDPTQSKFWGTVEEAAEELECSASTARRKVDRHARKWRRQLLRLTRGGQRRINLLLLRELESDRRMGGVLRLAELTRLREVHKKNKELEKEIKKGGQALESLQEEVARLKRRIAALTPE